MPDPYEVDWDVSGLLPPVVLELDVASEPEVRSRLMTRHLDFVAGQDILLELRFKKTDESLIPPSLVAVDITGWAAKWVVRDEDDAILFVVAGVVVDAAAGRMQFTVPAASFGVEGERMPGQFKVYTDGNPAGDPEFVEDHHVSARAQLLES